MVSVGDSTRRGKEYSKRFARSTTIACVDELCEACGVECGINFDPGRSWRGKHPKLRYDAMKRAREKRKNTHPERIAQWHVLFSRSDILTGLFVPFRDGIHQTTFTRNFVELFGALDEIGDVVAEVADGGERVDVSRRGFLSSSLLFGKRHAREQIFLHSRASFHSCHLALRERALDQIFVSQTNLLGSFADFASEFLRVSENECERRVSRYSRSTRALINVQLLIGCSPTAKRAAPCPRFGTCDFRQ